jgi:hypothetical protein
MGTLSGDRDASPQQVPSYHACWIVRSIAIGHRFSWVLDGLPSNGTAVSWPAGGLARSRWIAPTVEWHRPRKIAPIPAGRLDGHVGWKRGVRNRSPDIAIRLSTIERIHNWRRILCYEFRTYWSILCVTITRKNIDMPMMSTTVYLFN